MKRVFYQDFIRKSIRLISGAIVNSVDFLENNIPSFSLLLLLFNTHKNIELNAKNSAVSLFSALEVCYRQREEEEGYQVDNRLPFYLLSDNKFNSHLLTTIQHKESMVCNVDWNGGIRNLLNTLYRLCFIWQLTIFKCIASHKLFTVCSLDFAPLSEFATYYVNFSFLFSFQCIQEIAVFTNFCYILFIMSLFSLS